ELLLRVSDRLCVLRERRLERIGVEGRVEAASAERLGELETLVYVPRGGVVGEDRARDVGAAARSGHIARGCCDRVLGAPWIGDPVACGVDAPALPGGRHELHPADRTGGARPHVRAEVRLDLVDRREHLPRDAVEGGVALAERGPLGTGWGPDA